MRLRSVRERKTNIATKDAQRILSAGPTVGTLGIPGVGVGVGVGEDHDTV